MAAAQSENHDTPQGLAFAITAYCLWGFLPIYLKAVSYMPVGEILVHRILWSVPVAGAVLIVLRRTADLREALRNPRMLVMATVTAALISVNWVTYIWAIDTGQALDAALGYYINPLFSVFLGAVLLGERLGRLQMVAIALAVLAVLVLTYETGRVPWVALVLSVSWGFYALAKKSLPLGPNQGFLLEAMILSVPALGYAIWLATQGEGHFLAGSWRDTLLLMGAGPVTAIPLIFYANGAKLLRLSTIGFLQYIAPTLIMCVAVFVFGEPFGEARMIAFPMIWAALVVFSIPMIRSLRARRG